MKHLSTTKLKASKGKTISQAKNVFTGWMDSDFKNYGTDVAVEDSKAQTIEVYEQEKNGTLQDIFGSFGDTNLDSLCLTQGQIIDIVKNHSDILLQDGWYNFFLFKVGSEFFVARVDRFGGFWGVRAYRLSYGSVWRAGRRRRVVVPKLSTLKPRHSDALTLSISNQDDIDKAIAFVKESGYQVSKIL